MKQHIICPRYYLKKVETRRLTSEVIKLREKKEYSSIFVLRHSEGPRPDLQN